MNKQMVMPTTDEVEESLASSESINEDDGRLPNICANECDCVYCNSISKTIEIVIGALHPTPEIGDIVIMPNGRRKVIGKLGITATLGELMK